MSQRHYPVSLSAVVLGLLVVLSSAYVHAQFSTNRAVQRAIETNTRSALERVQLALKVEDSAGKVVVQKTSRNGRYLLLVFADNRPRVWDLEKSRYWDQFDSADAPIVAAAIGGDMRFATVHSDGSIARWSPESSTPISVSQTSLDAVQFVAMDRTQNLILVAGDGKLFAFDDSLRRLGQASADLAATRTALAMDPSGSIVATAVGPSRLQFWSTRDGVAVADATLDEEITAFAFGEESRQLLIGTSGAVVDWDVRGSNAVGKFACASSCRLERLLVNAATQSLIGVDERGELLRWSLGDRRALTGRLVKEQDLAQLSTAAGAPILIGGTTRGLVQFSHLDRPDTELTLVSTRRGWAMIDPLGRFDGQAGEDNGVSWGNGELDLPLPSFVDTHFEPGLFNKWLNGSASYLTEPKALADGVLAPPKIEMSLAILEPQNAKRLIEVLVKVTDGGGGIGTPSLYHLGLRVSTDKLVERRSSVENDKKVSWTTWRVTALPGENTFTAKVHDAEGVVAPGRVESLQVAGQRVDPALHLLAIAIDDYGDKSLNLNYSIADANAVVDQLETLAAPLFSAVHKTVVRNEEATRDRVIAAIRSLRQANPEDVIVIYAATHGDVFDDKFHLLLQGLKLPVSKRRLKRTGLAFDEFSRELEMLDARRVVMLLDTCKSGDALEDLQSEFRDRRALQSFGNLLGVHLIAATAKGQLATESSVLGHGVFTYSIIEGLKGKADQAPADGVLTASELAGFTEAGVPALSARYASFPQWPTVYARGFDFSVATRSVPLER